MWSEDDAEKKRLVALMAQDEMRMDFSALVKETFPKMQWGWFYDHLCEVLEEFLGATIRGESPRLIVNVPPRLGKSEICTVRFPLWAMLNYAAIEIIACSYAQNLAVEFSRKARELTFHPYVETLWGTKTKGGQFAAEKWNLSNGSSYQATSICGSIVGKGCHCLVADTTIMCYQGQKRISDIKVGDLVLSFDHENHSLCYAKVLATHKEIKNEISQVKTRHGRVLGCSSDHRIFTENGYKNAIDTVQNERLIAARRVHSMQFLQQDIHQAKIRSRKEHKKQIAGYLLRTFMFPKSSRSKESSVVRVMQKTNRQKDKKILRRMQKNRYPENPDTIALPYLQYYISTNHSPNQDMRKGLRQYPSFATNEKRRKSQVHIRSRIQNYFQEDQTIHRRKRWPLSTMQSKRRSIGAPHGRKQAPQSARKFSYPMQILPCNLSQDSLESDYVQEVTSTSGKEVCLYDIQTEKFHNFFANGILVHNCLIIDDPIKNIVEADSAHHRNAIYEWFGSSAITRLAPGGGVIIVMQRWHEFDLTGQLKRKEKVDGGDHWDLIEYQAIAENDEPFRAKGESILPIRFPVSLLKKTENAMVARIWRANYQQRPTRKGGNIFDGAWFHRYDRLPTPEPTDLIQPEWISSWDLRFGDSQKKSSSFVCGQVWMRLGAQKYLVDQVRGRWDFSQSIAAFKELMGRYPQCHSHLIENKANGPAMENVLKNEVSGIMLRPPNGDKIQRAEAAQPTARAGNVHIPDENYHIWVTTWLDEMTTFPGSEDDDQVDCYSQAINYMLENETSLEEVICVQTYSSFSYDD